VVILLTKCKKGDSSSAVSDPIATTYTATWVGQEWATLNGSVNANNYNINISFEYDTTTAYLHTIAATPDTLSGNVNTTVSSELTGLTKNTTYHYRLKVATSGITKYGIDYTFTTPGTDSTVIVFNPDLTYGSVTDYEGNIYKTVDIGTQTWMAENLKSIKYKDGTAIPFVTDVTKWGALSTPAYCWYNNDSIGYGAMYNWYTVNTSMLCPAGWHVPSDAEWTTLEDYLGGSATASGKLREVGTTHWSSTNSDVTNESGFTALPGGYRNSFGSFNSIRSHAYWWTATQSTPVDAYSRGLYFGYNEVDRSSTNYRAGLFIRCVKD
jgi:uncharacterized protein (TIGR02145 family)